MSDAIVRLLLNTSGFDSNLQRSKGKMKDFSTQGSSTSSVLKGWGGTLSKVTGGLAAAGTALKVAGGLATAGTALKVATDAFMTSETNVDAWGRTVESAKGLYEGFLNSLNTGDISGFLNNISQIVSAAEDAYNALDELNTYKAFNQVNAARAKAGYAEALDAYKLNPTKENKEALAKANAEVIKNLREEAQKQGVAYDKALSELFAKREALLLITITPRDSSRNTVGGSHYRRGGLALLTPSEEGRSIPSMVEVFGSTKMANMSKQCLKLRIRRSRLLKL